MNDRKCTISYSRWMYNLKHIKSSWSRHNKVWNPFKQRVCKSSYSRKSINRSIWDGCYETYKIGYRKQHLFHLDWEEPEWIKIKRNCTNLGVL